MSRRRRPTDLYPNTKRFGAAASEQATVTNVLDDLRTKLGAEGSGWLDSRAANGARAILWFEARTLGPGLCDRYQVSVVPVHADGSPGVQVQAICWDALGGHIVDGPYLEKEDAAGRMRLTLIELDSPPMNYLGSLLLGGEVRLIDTGVRSAETVAAAA